MPLGRRQFWLRIPRKVRCEFVSPDTLDFTSKSALRNMKQLQSVDVVIVGAGWAGLSMAKELATRTGLSVLVLERGQARKSSDYASSMDEVDYAIRLRMMQSTADETHTHRHSPGGTAVPIRQHGSFLPGSGVGGAGEHWNGMSYRFDPDQFTLLLIWGKPGAALTSLRDSRFRTGVLRMPNWSRITNARNKS